MNQIVFLGNESTVQGWQRIGRDETDKPIQRFASDPFLTLVAKRWRWSSLGRVPQTTFPSARLSEIFAPETARLLPYHLMSSSS